MPKVSVIIPVYNSEKYLKECLDSLINQTLKDIEIICVNDGSKDGSQAILEEYAAYDNRIKIINQENKGSAGARNFGIKEAKGQYIGFVDSDDVVNNLYFETLYKTAVKNKADIAATSNCIIFDTLNNAKKLTGLENKKIITSIKDKAEIITTTGMSCNKIYKQNFLINNNISCLELKNPAEDNYFTVCAIITASKIAVNNDAIYYYRKNETSQTQVLKDKTSFSVIDVYRAIDSYILNQNFKQEEKELWLTVLKERKLIDYCNFIDTMKNSCKTEFKQAFKEAFFKTLKPVIVSLTSYPARINTVNKTIESLLEQNFQADKIILWLGEEQFPSKEKELPKELLALCKKGLIIEWCSDIKSYKKLIPALRKYPDSIIVTADDDLIYQKKWLENLVLAYIKNPEYIHCHRAHLILFDKKGKIKPYEKWAKEVSGLKPSFNNFPTSGGGALYPPHILYKDIFNEEKFKQLTPMADDIWFWAMAVLNGTKINVIKDNISKLNYIEGTQENGLYTINITKNDEQLINVLCEYPEILKKLKKIKSYDGLTFLQKLFSVKNIYRHEMKHKTVRLLGLKFSFNTNKISSIFKSKNFQVRKNSILLTEVNDNDHAEVLPGYAKYLLDLGYNVDIVLTENNYKMNSLCRIKNENLRIYPIERHCLGKFFNSSTIKKYSKIFFTSHITYYSIGDLSFAKYKPRNGKYVTIFEHFPVLNKYKNKIFTVEHHLDLADKELIQNKRVISLAKFDTQDKNYTMVNPNYFGEIKITGKNEKITKFITIGSFFAHRKNTAILTETVKKLKEQGFDNFEISAIGQYKSEDFSLDDMKNINFLGRSSADVVYDKMEEADFFLPMLDPENQEHERYITTGTSGSFQLIYGFNKPCLIAEKFAKPHYFNENNSVIYKTNNDFIEAMKQAINMKPEEYSIMQKHLSETTNKIRAKSIQNLKEILKN